MLNKGPDRISPFFVPMIISNMASALVAIKYRALGVTLPVVTACATSTNAIGEAYRAIKHGYADAIITGGADACINPLAVGGFANCMALIATDDIDNASIPFDKRRRGFVMGEGSAVLVLEEYEHAIKRGARIYCEISGYANTCDAYHMTAPHPEAFGCIKMIELLLQEYGKKIDKKTYINMHGTSTPMNDRVETYAVKKVLSDLAYEIPVSSTKSVTGHMLGAAGAMEAIFAIKSLNEGIIPPTIGYREKDEECDLDYVPNEARKYDIDVAMSFSLGFGGHNGGILFNRV
jgi:3-oxoacyl-[acyl-carrier-protein] synthase II